MAITVPRIGWDSLGRVEKPGTYMFQFGWVTVTDEDLRIWAQFPEATSALYEAPGAERAEVYRYTPAPRRHAVAGPYRGLMCLGRGSFTKASETSALMNEVA